MSYNNEINYLITILDNETKSLVNNNYDIFENFKREYTLFIKLLYDRLKEEESKCLDNLRTNLGECVLSFGTDEFTCDYKNWSLILASIDEALGRDFEPNKYANPLIVFRNMYNNFFRLINGNPNSKESLEKFSELTKKCLEKAGFDKVKTEYFMGSLIFEIDNCSRIAKGMDSLYEEQRKYREKNPGSLIITDEYTIKNYVGNYLDNWFKQNDKAFDADNNDRKKLK